ncbi:putative glutathione-dependent formaldehyde-activating enzyme [Colletotrichum sublineola]|uniref:Putative glutathione-dependent formaldehyde-activating enzyme n=1 Tax=Colletotrichum sublineola TaxID=1173701 RepID=A0A066XDA4_COLSU|nr:putative glutathione-dependent formaldehyde-activating enzyme [Colletotrichum sublineola]
MGLRGSCMCKAVKYESDCQKVCVISTCPGHTEQRADLDTQWSGSAFTSNAVVPRASFKVTQGEPKFYDIVGDSGKNNRHFFCSNCGSSLYTELDLMPDVTCIKAGGLDDGKASLDGKPAVEFYCKDRVSYLTDVKSAEQKPAFQ